MGIITSKDTRRISFNNTLDMSPPIIQKSVDKIDITPLCDFDQNASNEFNLRDTNSKCIKLGEEDFEYWAHRIEALKTEHHEINQIIETEYKKTIENNKKLFDPPKISQDKIQKVKPCFDWRAKILQCYEDNPKQPLVCSAIVQAFNNCVSSCQLED